MCYRHALSKYVASNTCRPLSVPDCLNTFNCTPDKDTMEIFADGEPVDAAVSAIMTVEHDTFCHCASVQLHAASLHLICPNWD